MIGEITQEIREELLKLRDENLKLKAFFSDGTIDRAFSEMPRSEEAAPVEYLDMSQEAEGFVMGLAEKMIEKCCGFSKNGEDGYGEISIDPLDGETHVVMNWCETDEVASEYSLNDIKSNAPEALSIIAGTIGKIHSANCVDEIRRVEISYQGFGDSMDGIDVAFFELDKESGKFNEIGADSLPSAIVDDLEMVADRMISGFGHDGFWNNEGGSGRIKIFCPPSGELDVEYIHNDNLEYYEKEEFHEVCEEIVGLLNDSPANVRPGKPAR